MGLRNPFYAPFTPLLDPDWDDPEPWLLTVVNRIGRRPQMIARSDFFTDHHSALTHSWEDAEKRSHNANRLHSAYLTDEIIAPRAVRRKLLQEAVREETAFNAAMRKQAIAREEQKRQAQNQAKDERWTRHLERHRILSENWICERCKGRAIAYPHGEKYKMVCYSCPREAIIEHERLMVVVNAKRQQPGA